MERYLFLHPHIFHPVLMPTQISFGGEADVTKLMTALSGASQEASSNNAAASVAVSSGASVVTPETTTSTSAIESAVPSATEAASVPVGVNGIGRDVIEPRTADTVEAEKRDVETREVEIKIKARTSDQEKRDLEEQDKRDLAGFNAALAFATGMNIPPDFESHLTLD